MCDTKMEAFSVRGRSEHQTCHLTRVFIWMCCQKDCCVFVFRTVVHDVCVVLELVAEGLMFFLLTATYLGWPPPY